MRWLISVPVWGDEFVGRFKGVGLPMIRQAAEQIKDPVVLVVHTDQPEYFINIGIKSQVKAPPAGAQWFNTLSRAHADVLNMAGPDDAVMLLTADMTISVDALAACEKRFSQGKRLICCNATRTLDSGVLPYRPRARELSEWGWRNRHPMVNSCIWPNGNAPDLSRVYFRNGDNVVCRMWLPHPLAVRPHGRSLNFGPTIDCNLICHFKPHESHLVTDADEMSAIELSPASKLRGSHDRDEKSVPFTLGMMAERYALLRIGHEIYNWALAQRIIVSGTGENCGDDVIDPIIKLAKTMSAMPPPLVAPNTAIGMAQAAKLRAMAELAKRQEERRRRAR